MTRVPSSGSRISDATSGYAVRALARTPGFAVAAVLTLAIGIGGSTAVFSLIDAVLLRPLPVPNADRVVMVYMDASKFGFPRGDVSPAVYGAWASQNDVFDALAASAEFGAVLQNNGEPLRINRPPRHQVAVRRPRRSRACGAHVPAFGGSARRAERGGAELWPLAAPLRRRPVTRRPFYRHQQLAVPRRRRDAEDIPVPRRLRRPLGAGGVHFRGADQRRALSGRGGTDEAGAQRLERSRQPRHHWCPSGATASGASLSTARGRRVAEGRGLRRRANADARAPRCSGRRLA